MMDATATVARIGRAIERNGLEAVLIGNAGAAIHGAPVTTDDIDFLYRRTPANLRKIRRIAEDLEAVVFAPFCATSGILRMMNDDETLQVDFMDQVSGIRSFEGIRKRARQVTIEGAKLMVADLSDIIKMKRAAGRAKDRAVLEILEKTLEATQTNQEDKPSSA